MLSPALGEGRPVLGDSKGVCQVPIMPTDSQRMPGQWASCASRIAAMCWIISSVDPSILGGVYWPVLLCALIPQGIHRLNSKDTVPMPVLLKALHKHHPAASPPWLTGLSQPGIPTRFPPSPLCTNPLCFPPRG